MKNSSQDSYLDLIFESRNKAYGAYHLRRRSSLFLGLALVLSISLILGGFVLLSRLARPAAVQTSGGTIKMQHRKVVGYSQLSAPPPIETAPAPAAETPTVKRGKAARLATRKFLPPVAVPDAEMEPEEAIPTQRELKKVNPGKTTVEGDSIGSVDPATYDEAVIELDIDIEVNPLEAEEAPVPAPAPPPPPPLPKTEEKPKAPTPEPAEQKVYTFAEVPARFPGGEAAMFRFIADHLEYPEIARENNIQGTLLLQMTIEADGSITNIKVLRDIGGNCGEAAIRMVKMMPRWEPAVQQSIHVRFNVVLPIQFRLN